MLCWQKPVPSQTVLKDSKSGQFLAGGGGDSALPENVKTITLTQRPAPKKHSIIAESNVDEDYHSASAKRTSTSDHPATIAEPGDVLEHKATVEQPVVAEHLIPVEQSDAAEHGHSADLVRAMSENLSTASKHSVKAESSQSTTAESHIIMQHSGSLESEHPVGAEQ